TASGTFQVVMDTASANGNIVADAVFVVGPADSLRAHGGVAGNGGSGIRSIGGERGGTLAITTDQLVAKDSTGDQLVANDRLLFVNMGGERTPVLSDSQPTNTTETRTADPTTPAPAVHQAVDSLFALVGASQARRHDLTLEDPFGWSV